MTTTTPADLVTADPNPSDVMYDDVTRAWRNGDHMLAWHLADALLQYDANGGEVLTGFRDLYYVHAIHDYYRPADVPDVRNEVTQ